MVLGTLPEEISRKVPGTHKSKHLSDKSHYPTQEKMKIDVEVAARKKAEKQDKQQALLKDGTITKRIYDILVQNRGIYMTPREIYDTYDDKSLWKINSNTPLSSIGKLLLDLYYSKKIEKIDGPKYIFNK